MSDTLTIIRPDDWHVHLRDGDALAAVAPHTAAQFARAVVMPNLKPAVTTTAQALAYKQRIQAALPDDSKFEPLMTLYLTDHTPADEIQRAHDSGVVAVTLYPAGATTNSSAGVTDLRHTHKTLEAMQLLGMPLLVHGEVTDPEIDVFDREAVFIDKHLAPLRRDFPQLKIVLEHITTREAAICGAGRGLHRSHHHSAPFVVQSQCLVFGGCAAALLLLAGAQTRNSSPGIAACRGVRQRPVLFGYRQRTACRAFERACQWLCRLLHRFVGAGVVCASV